MRLALMGTRGVPALYGGFETAAEEIGRRLVDRGHSVTVYCRNMSGLESPDSYLGMQLVHLPSVRHKAIETLSNTALSAIHHFLGTRQDAVILFNSANSPFIPIIQARGVPTVTHVDGLEWQRSKWGPMGRRYYRAAESLAVRWSDALIADAQGIASYYAREFGVATDFIPYGAPILTDVGSERLAELDIEPHQYHLVVARFEPENHIQLALEGLRHSAAQHPLIVVGSAPYASRYTDTLVDLARRDVRIRLIGSVWDQALLDQLYANSLTYIHGHSVGGTNPSLLRAMGAAASVIAYDVTFNREVLGPLGHFFHDSGSLAAWIDASEDNPTGARDSGRDLQRRAAGSYDWDVVAAQYEALCIRVAAGASQRHSVNGRRSPGGSPQVDAAPTHSVS